MSEGTSMAFGEVLPEVVAPPEVAVAEVPSNPSELPAEPVAPVEPPQPEVAPTIEPAPVPSSQSSIVGTELVTTGSNEFMRVHYADGSVVTVSL